MTSLGLLESPKVKLSSSTSFASSLQLKPFIRHVQSKWHSRQVKYSANLHVTPFKSHSSIYRLVSQELAAAFANAVSSGQTRILRISIAKGIVPHLCSCFLPLYRFSEILCHSFINFIFTLSDTPIESLIENGQSPVSGSFEEGTKILVLLQTPTISALSNNGGSTFSRFWRTSEIPRRVSARFHLGSP